MEAIADLVTESGEARVVDLARRLGVTHVTVNRTIARLQKAGYVTAQPYRAIFFSIMPSKNTLTKTSRSPLAANRLSRSHSPWRIKPYC